MQYVKIPEKRLGVLIGNEGATMHKIESRAHVKLNVDSENHQVIIEHTGNPIDELIASDII